MAKPGMEASSAFFPTPQNLQKHVLPWDTMYLQDLLTDLIELKKNYCLDYGTRYTTAFTLVSLFELLRDQTGWLSMY